MCPLQPGLTISRSCRPARRIVNGAWLALAPANVPLEVREGSRRSLRLSGVSLACPADGSNNFSGPQWAPAERSGE
jgi:hypothetical protein